MNRRALIVAAAVGLVVLALAVLFGPRLLDNWAIGNACARNTFNCP